MRSHHRTTSWRRVAVAGVCTASLLAGGLGTTAVAEEEVPDEDVPHEPDVVVFHDGLTVNAGFEEFEGCPVIMGPDAAGLGMCLRLEISGPLNFGDVDATIDEPMEMIIGIRQGDENAGIPPVVAAALAEDGEPQKLEGGLLGVPELDALLNPVDALVEDVAGAPVWGLYADADIADPDAQIDGLVEVVAIFGLLGPFVVGEGEEITMEDFFAAFGMDTEEFLGEQTIGLPISVHLRNLLFGDNCYIGTPDDRININLTTGTTDPPAGVDPMTGSYGSLVYEAPNPVENPTEYITRIVRSGFVDNTFAVPGASGCDAVVGGLLGQPQGLLDPVINQLTGLPSAAGGNAADFRIDFAVAPTAWVYDSSWSATPSEKDFGEVPVNARSQAQTFVIENTGGRPTQVGEILLNPVYRTHFQEIKNTCYREILQVGDTCEVISRGYPRALGTHTAVLGFSGGADSLGTPEEPWTVKVTGI